MQIKEALKNKGKSPSERKYVRVAHPMIDLFLGFLIRLSRTFDADLGVMAPRLRVVAPTTA